MLALSVDASHTKGECMITLSSPRPPEPKDRKKEDAEWDDEHRRETYVNEPAVRDPKPSKNPDVYEMV